MQLLHYITDGRAWPHAVLANRRICKQSANGNIGDPRAIELGSHSPYFGNPFCQPSGVQITKVIVARYPVDRLKKVMPALSHFFHALKLDPELIGILLTVSSAVCAEAS